MTSTTPLPLALTHRLAGFDLPGGGGLPTDPLDGRGWKAFVEVVRAEQVEGILADAIASGRWPATAEQAEEARGVHREAMASVLFIDRRLRELAPALDRSGTRWRVLGGPAIAHVDEPDPSWRTYRRLDLLVDGDGFHAAAHLLAGLGGVRRGPDRSDALARRDLQPMAAILADGVEVRVHRTLAGGPYGSALDPALLLGLPTAELTVGGVRVEALGRPGRFLDSCYRAVLGRDEPRASTLRGVALTFPHDEPTARAAHGLARACGGEAVLAEAVKQASDTLGWEPSGELARWARSLRPHERDRRWLAAYGTSGSALRRILLEAEALPDMRSRITCAAAVVVDLVRDAAASARS